MRGVFWTGKARADVGPPGAINWADPGPVVSDDGENNPYLDFYTQRGTEGFTDLLGPHLVLLDGYAATGDGRYLARWAEVLDDWALNVQWDMDGSPYNVRQYPILWSFRPAAVAATLADAAGDRPGLLTDLPAATLARVLTVAMEEYPAAFVRQARGGIYNWRVIAEKGAVVVAQAFPEFHAVRWMAGENRRLMELNWSHKIALDGGNLEQGNMGHEPNDQVHLGEAYRTLAARPPDWMDDAWRAEWQDHMRVNARYFVHLLKPDGFEYKFGLATTADLFLKHGRFDRADTPIQVNMLIEEPETRRRLRAAFGDQPAVRREGGFAAAARTAAPVEDVGPPRVRSEFLPYIGYAALRGGWEKDDSFLYFQSSPLKDTGGRQDNNGFRLHAHGQALLLAPPTVVDGRTQNIHYGLVENPGGKTFYLTYDDRGRPVPHRFHTSAAFDFVEGRYDGVYQYAGNKAEVFVFGDYGYAGGAAKRAAAAAKKGEAFDNAPVRDVRHVRQVFAVRGEELYVAVDRLLTEGEHRYAQHFTVATPVPRAGWRRRLALAAEVGRPALAVDDDADSIRTDNRTLPGLSVYHVGPPTLDVTATPERPSPKLAAAETVDQVLEALGGGKYKKWYAGQPIPFARQTKTEWQGRGPQVLVTAVRTHAGDEGGPARPDFRAWEPIRQADGITGFRAETPAGSKVLFLTAARTPAKLAAGIMDVTGEALLLTTPTTGPTRGVALGVEAVHVGGRAVSVPAADFEFVLADGGLRDVVAIHRPIEPVEIRPGVNVFADAVDVTMASATPGVEVRYTLDGSDPTARSPRYAEPLRLTATTRVKARAVSPRGARRGLPLAARRHPVLGRHRCRFRKADAAPGGHRPGRPARAPMGTSRRHLEPPPHPRGRVAGRAYRAHGDVSGRGDARRGRPLRRPLFRLPQRPRRRRVHLPRPARTPVSRRRRRVRPPRLRGRAGVVSGHATPRPRHLVGRAGQGAASVSGRLRRPAAAAAPAGAVERLPEPGRGLEGRRTDRGGKRPRRPAAAAARRLALAIGSDQAGSYAARASGRAASAAASPA